MADLTQRYAEFVSSRSRLLILAFLLATVLVGAGVAFGSIESAGIGEFEVDAPETEATTFVEENYAQDERIVSQLVVRDRDGDVLTRDSLLAGIELQVDVRDNPELNETLTADGFVGIENIIATAAYFEDTDQLADSQTDSATDQPSLSAQRDALANRSESEIDALLEAVIAGEAELPSGADPLAFLPRDFDRDNPTEAEARLTLLFQVHDDEDDTDAAYAAQVEIAELVEQRFDDAFLFGQGINDEISGQAVGDSFIIITPVALAFVLFVLGVAYRDPLDIILGFVGIALVLVWLFGLLAWLEIPTSQLFIAIPFLLIGLSIDYALHVVMRYREAREGTLGLDSMGAEFTDPGVRKGMALGLGSVILALSAATFSTGVGFLSNVVSPLPAIQDFAILCAGGIVATFFVFGLFLPAVKIELDESIETRFNRTRRRPAFGVGEGLANRGLSRVASIASSAPVIIIFVALLLATGGAFGATTIDTEFNEADFIPREAPSWTQYLPGPLEPGTYTIRADFTYLSENFALGGDSGEAGVLIRESNGDDLADDGSLTDGSNLTDGQVLVAIDEATQSVPENSINRLADDEAAIEGPHTVIREIAAENETVQAAVDDRDTTGDGLPNEDVAAVFDLLFGADADAAAEIASRDDAGELTSLRLVVSVRADASAQSVAGDVRAVATDVEDGAPVITAVATGGPVTTAVLQDALLETLVQALTVTIVVILAFLSILFWRRYRSLSLGPVVLAPVVVSLCWLLGAMALLDIPFNSETAVITSLAIGLGVDYSIHAGERFIAERERRPSLSAALESTITGTGGALLASAGTTAAGFGVLGLSLAPPIQRFGIVTGAAIILAFIACLTVLPCLLVVRERVIEWRAKE